MTTTAVTATFLVHAVDPAEADRLRAAGGLVRVADSSPGWPCRQCLRDADVGEELLLVSYDPFDRASASPYRTPSPIFLHRAPCPPAAPTPELPVQLTSRRLSLRAFDDAALMIDGRVVDGADLADALHEVLADPAVATVHVHNAGPGCYAARVTRR